MSKLENEDMLLWRLDLVAMVANLLKKTKMSKIRKEGGEVFSV